MRTFLDCFIDPYWMELLGVGFLAVSIFVDRPFIVYVGFALLIAGSLVNGLSHVWEKFREWRNRPGA